MSQHLLLIALAVLIPGLAFVPWHWPYDINHTFSQHVARYKHSTYYYFGLFLVVLPLLYLYFVGYLIPDLNLPFATKWLIAIASLTQLGCTTVPEVGGTKTKIHLVFATISALALFGVLIMIIQADISTVDRLLVVACASLMALIVAAVASLKQKQLPALILQSSYFGLFFIAILTVHFD